MSRWKSQLCKKIHVKFPTIWAEFHKQIRSTVPKIPSFLVGGLQLIGAFILHQLIHSVIHNPCVGVRHTSLSFACSCSPCSCLLDSFIAYAVPVPLEAEIGFQFIRPFLIDTCLLSKKQLFPTHSCCHYIPDFFLFPQTQRIQAKTWMSIQNVQAITD